MALRISDFLAAFYSRYSQSVYRDQEYSRLYTFLIMLSEWRYSDCVWAEPLEACLTCKAVKRRRSTFTEKERLHHEPRDLSPALVHDEDLASTDEHDSANMQFKFYNDIPKSHSNLQYRRLWPLLRRKYTEGIEVIVTKVTSLWSAMALILGIAFPPDMPIAWRLVNPSFDGYLRKLRALQKKQLCFTQAISFLAEYHIVVQKNMAVKTAYVTGGASGIGRAVAEMLAKRGIRVAIADKNYAEALPLNTPAKHGVVGFIRSYRKHLPTEATLLNAICPNMVRTNFSTAAFHGQMDSRNLIVPMEFVVQGFEECLDTDISGEAFEIDPHAGVRPRTAPEPFDKYAADLLSQLHQQSRPLHEAEKPA